MVKQPLTNKLIREAYPAVSLEDVTLRNTLDLINMGITEIDNLELFFALEFLNLSSNKIKTVENIDFMPKLHTLDLSHNLVVDIDTNELPVSLRKLILKGNPCTKSKDFVQSLSEKLPRVEIIATNPDGSSSSGASGDDDGPSHDNSVDAPSSGESKSTSAQNEKRENDEHEREALLNLRRDLSKGPLDPEGVLQELVERKLNLQDDRGPTFDLKSIESSLDTEFEQAINERRRIRKSKLQGKLLGGGETDQKNKTEQMKFLQEYKSQVEKDGDSFKAMMKQKVAKYDPTKEVREQQLK